MFLFLGAACYLFIRAIAQSLRSHALKKRAKVLLFFEIRKYFLKKMQKKFVFLQNVRFIWQKHNQQTPSKLG